VCCVAERSMSPWSRVSLVTIGHQRVAGGRVLRRLPFRLKVALKPVNAERPFSPITDETNYNLGSIAIPYKSRHLIVRILEGSEWSTTDGKAEQS
jgi:hypothetical protein